MISHNLCRMLLQVQAPSVDPMPTVPDEVRQLSTLSLDELLDKLVNVSVQFAINLAIALIVFYIGKFIIKRIHRLVGNIMLRRGVDTSLSTFILSFIRIVLYFILIVTVIGILGVETSSFLALFASAGVAIGMALSGTLQNFAGGILILLLKPYRVGDYIEAQGFAGTVKEIQMFSTLILTIDNRAILIPNGVLSTSTINNASHEDYRRVQWNIGISYGDDVAAARQTILNMLLADDMVIKRYIEDDRQSVEAEQDKEETERQQLVDSEYESRGFLYRLFHHRRRLHRVIEERREKLKEKFEAQKPRTDRSPSVNVDSLGDSSVNLVVRAWTRSENYWPLYYKFNEAFYYELPRRGINFPFPQLDVHFGQSGPAD